ncbi:MAG: AraC family transcriptional regulator [Pseudomonadota bacterium]
MSKIDRLSALMSRFELSVSLCDASEANFRVIGDCETGAAQSLVLAQGDKNLGRLKHNQIVLLNAKVQWGGDQNPMMAALPRRIQHELGSDSDVRAIVELLLSEHRMARCGSASVLNRLGEVLLVRIMRSQIEAAHLAAGLFGGLADPRLSRAIVAIHDSPEVAWRVESLAAEAGLSVSHFSQLFRDAVGVTPLAYLRKWRLVLAKQDIERGDRVQMVANRYCYGSTEALSRAFVHAYGASPTQLRKSASSLSKASA